MYYRKTLLRPPFRLPQRRCRIINKPCGGGRGFRLPRFRSWRGSLRGGKSIPSAGIVLAVCLVLIGICIFLEHAARPQIRALSEIAARKEATTALNTAVEEILREEEVEYASLVHIVSSQAGISSIASDTYEINLLKGRIVDAVEEQISKSRIKLSLPLGTLLGSELFAGTGPNIPVSLRMQGHVAATVKSDLSSSGVNQTMHRILLPLTVELNVILPGEGLETEFETTVCLAETVIVGDVPTGLITGSAP